MNGVAVHIMLHGLIAVVPGTGADGQLNHMTALLVDARESRPIECFAQHTPTVRFFTSELECLTAGCSLSNDECTCALDFDEITLTPDVEPTAEALHPTPPSSLPFDKKRALAFGYVANLASGPIGQELNRRFLEPVPPTSLVARMRFPFAKASACFLATRRDESGENVHPAGFRKLGQHEAENEPNQAIAQMLMVHYLLPEEVSTLRLELRTFGETAARTFTLTQGKDGYFITLENKRTTLAVDAPCDDGVGRDFALLYDLAENPPAWEDRKVPHVKYTRWKSSAELANDACTPVKDPMSRPICPIGSFF